MIFEVVLDFVFSAVVFLINLMPTLPSFVSNGIDFFIKILSSSFYFFDAKAFNFLITTAISFYAVQFVWAIIEWIYKKIPGVD